MHATTKPMLVLFIAMALGAGCATSPGMRDADRLALYEQHAGPPVPSFRYLSISGWTPLGDSALAVWTRPSEAYLLTLSGSCPDLKFANAISLSSQFRTVHARFDRVLPIGPGPNMSIACHIQEIRPLDVRGVRQAQREIRSEVREAQRD